MTLMLGQRLVAFVHQVAGVPVADLFVVCVISLVQRPVRYVPASRLAEQREASTDELYEPVSPRARVPDTMDARVKTHCHFGENVSAPREASAFRAGRAMRRGEEGSVSVREHVPTVSASDVRHPSHAQHGTPIGSPSPPGVSCCLLGGTTGTWRVARWRDR